MGTKLRSSSCRFSSSLGDNNYLRPAMPPTVSVWLTGPAPSTSSSEDTTSGASLLILLVAARFPIMLRPHRRPAEEIGGAGFSFSHFYPETGHKAPIGRPSSG